MSRPVIIIIMYKITSFDRPGCQKAGCFIFFDMSLKSVVISVNPKSLGIHLFVIEPVEAGSI